MNCKKIRELILTDYIDGEADEKTKMSVNAHVAECAECKELLSSVQKITPGTKNQCQILKWIP